MKLKKAVKVARKLNKLKEYKYMGIAVDADRDIYAYSAKTEPCPGGQWSVMEYNPNLKVIFVGEYSGSKHWKETWRNI